MLDTETQEFSFFFFDWESTPYKAKFHETIELS